MLSFLNYGVVMNCDVPLTLFASFGMMIEPRSVAGINGRLNGGWARYPDGIVALGVGV